MRSSSVQAKSGFSRSSKLPCQGPLQGSGDVGSLDVCLPQGISLGRRDKRCDYCQVFLHICFDCMFSVNSCVSLGKQIPVCHLIHSSELSSAPGWTHAINIFSSLSASLPPSLLLSLVIGFSLSVAGVYSCITLSLLLSGRKALKTLES